MQITVNRSQSVLAEHRSHTAVDDFHDRVQAASVDDSCVAVACVADLTIAGRPALYFTADRQRLVVDAALMSDLTAVDVPALAAGQRIRIGLLTERGRLGATPRRLVELLIRADILRTYWHIGSRVSLLRDETGADGSYHAQLDGVHTYFTNEENSDPFAFEVWISVDGLIEVAGR